MSDQSDVGQHVVDQRRQPFCYQTHAALDLIRASFEGSKRSVAIAIYVALTETANREGGAAARDGFQARRDVVAEHAGVSLATLDRYMPRFIEIGLVEVLKRKAGAFNLPNVWTLIDPQSEAPGRTGSPGKPHSAPPRARSSSEAKKTSKEGEIYSQATLIEVDSEPSLEVAETLVAQPLDAMPLPPAVLRIEGRDLPFDALADACGLERRDPAYASIVNVLKGVTSEKGGKTPVMGIYEIAWNEVVEQVPYEIVKEMQIEPAKWQQLLAQIIRYKARLYHERMPGAILTPKALRDWWMRLEHFDKITGTMSPESFADLFLDLDLGR